MVVDTKLYDILGVSPDVNDRDLKKAYQQKARELHPDKNRDDPAATERFQQVNEAYEILKDAQKRRIYDQLGPEGLRGQGGAGFEDVFSHLFGGSFFGGGDFGSPFGSFGFGGGGGGGSRRQRTRDVEYGLKVSLEDLYSGKQVTLRINREVLCPECKGSGCQKGKQPRRCSGCDGRGQRMQVSRMGNMITQQVVVCPDCQGRGECADSRDRCKKCGGSKTTQEAKAITVHVEPGMETGEQIRFRGCADEAPGAEAGDLVVVLQQKPHEFFLRRRADLLIAKKLTLAQALLGATFVLTHLDGRKLVVSPSANQIIAADSVKVIEREGMPQRGGGAKGRLFVKFEIEFPSAAQLTPELKAAFTSVLGVTDEAAGLDEEAEDVFPVRMQPGNIKEFNEAKSSRERRGEAYSSQEDEYEEAGQTAQCRPM